MPPPQWAARVAWSSPIREGKLRHTRNWYGQNVQRTGLRLLRRKPRDREERTMPVLFSPTHRRLTHKIFTEEAGEKRGCCDPAQAPLMSLGQKGAPPTPGKQKKWVTSKIVGRMMLKGARGTWLEAPLIPEQSPSDWLLTEALLPESSSLDRPADGLCPRISCLSNP